MAIMRAVNLPADLPPFHPDPPAAPWRARAGRALGLSLLAHVALALALVWLAQPGPTPDPVTPIRLNHGPDAGAAPAVPAPPVPSAQTSPAQPQSTAAATPPAAPAPPPPPENVAPAPDTASPTRRPPGGFGTDLAYLDLLRQQYLAQLQRHIGEHLWYPPEALERGTEGQVVLVIRLNRAGQLLSAGLAHSSGQAVLDAAALETVRRALPLPPPPDGLPYTELEVELPVSFTLDTKP